MQFKRSDFQGAAEAYLSALEAAGLTPGMAAVLNSNLSACELHLGRPKAALDRACDAISLDGTYGKAHHKAMKALIELGDLVGARQHSSSAPPEIQQPDAALLQQCEQHWDQVFANLT